MRQVRAEELLYSYKGKITTKIFQTVSRDTKNYPYSICQDGKIFPWLTLSGFTYEIDKNKPTILSTVWMCNKNTLIGKYLQDLKQYWRNLI